MLKLFECVRKNCKLIGIDFSDQNQSYFVYSKIILIYVPTIFALISSFGFLIFKANSPQEYDMSYFMIISSCASIAYFSVIIWKVPTILEMINQFEENIEKSGFIFIELLVTTTKKKINKIKFLSLESDDPVLKTNYQKLNATIELVSEIYYFLLKMSIPGVIFPPLLVTIVNYGLGNSSYGLPFPFLYVISIFRRRKNSRKIKNS